MTNPPKYGLRIPDSVGLDPSAMTRALSWNATTSERHNVTYETALTNSLQQQIGDTNRRSAWMIDGPHLEP